MQLKNVKDIYLLEDIELIKNLKIWNQSIESITQMNLLLSHKIISMAHGKERADQLFTTISSHLLLQWVLGNTERSEFAFWTAKDRFRLLSDLKAILDDFSYMESSAILFALFQNISIDDAVKIKWCDISESTLSKPAADILNQLPRHIAADLVFWEQKNNKPVALITLKQKLVKKTKLSWSEFNHRCATLYDDIN